MQTASATLPTTPRYALEMCTLVQQRVNDQDRQEEGHRAVSEKSGSSKSPYSTGIVKQQKKHAVVSSYGPGDAQPPATSTHSARQLPCLPSTSTMSVSHLHRHPTPFSLGGSGVAQYSSSSMRFFSSSVVCSRNGILGSWRPAGALAGQCWMVVCR